MKLRVQREDGRIEILTLMAPLTATVGAHQNAITDASGMDYWFTLEGYYDGWGRPMPGVPEDEMDILIKEVERHRVIEEPRP